MVGKPLYAYGCRLCRQDSTTTVLFRAEERVAEELPGWNFQIVKDMPGCKFNDKNEFGK